MYRFQVSCETQWGEEVCVVGSAPCLGSWDVSRAVPLKADYYPVWKTAAVDVSGAAPRLEYKYVKRSHGGSAQWEGGQNRWVPVDADAALTVHDGSFGAIQPEPFSFYEYDDRPKLHDAAPGQRRVVVIGSSVAEGFNSWRKRGWAWRLGQALAEAFGYELINVSQSGANTQATKERFEQAVCPWKPDIVVVGLSLGNEGLAHCPPDQRRAAQYRFEQGVLDLLRMVAGIGAVPMLGGVYPNNDFDAETYHMLKETARTMATWGVPIFDWLSALDDGQGRWRAGLYFDHAHPNSQGHQRMFESIDLSLFDPAVQKLLDLPEEMRRRDSLSKFDAIQRKTSHSSLEVLAQVAEAEEAEAGAEIVPAFDDGRGFSIVLCRGAMSVRNKTKHEYTISADWAKLCDALAAKGLAPGTYVSEESRAKGGRGDVLLVHSRAQLANHMAFPPGADVLLVPAFPPGAGRDR